MLVSTSVLLIVLIKVWYRMHYILSLGLALIPHFIIWSMLQWNGVQAVRTKYLVCWKVVTLDLPFHLSIDLILLTISHYEHSIWAPKIPN